MVQFFDVKDIHVVKKYCLDFLIRLSWRDARVYISGTHPEALLILSENTTNFSTDRKGLLFPSLNLINEIQL